MKTKSLPQRISGSNIAAVLGQSQFATRSDAFFSLAHGIEKERKPEEKFIMKLGLELEPVVARLYREHEAEMGRNISLKKPRPAKIVVDDWRAMSPDFEVFASNGDPANRLIECKTGRLYSREKWGTPFSDEIPTDYVFQTMWYMGIRRESKQGYEFTDVPVLLGGQEFYVYRVHFDQALYDLMLEQAHGFWKKHVITKTPPAPDGGRLMEDHLQETYKKYKHDAIEPASQTQIDLATEYLKARDEIARLEDEQERLKQELQLSIGCNEGFLWYDERGLRHEVTWKAQKETDWESVVRNAIGNDELALQRLILQHANPAWGKIAKTLAIEDSLITLYQKPGDRRLKFKVPRGE